MSEQTFHGAHDRISAADLDALQQELGYRLPEAFRAHYLRWNGGAPALDWIECAALFEPVRINSFKFVQPAGCSSGSSADLVGCYRLMRERDLIPAHLLPFAYDDGGNFFCLDMRSGAVLPGHAQRGGRLLSDGQLLR